MPCGGVCAIFFTLINGVGSMNALKLRVLLSFFMFRFFDENVFRGTFTVIDRVDMVLWRFVCMRSLRKNLALSFTV